MVKVGVGMSRKLYLRSSVGIEEHSEIFLYEEREVEEGKEVVAKLKIAKLLDKQIDAMMRGRGYLGKGVYEQGMKEKGEFFDILIKGLEKNE